ncbi:hypothetical protein BHE74_00013487 [Ensete ventricosum]|nr:hypothetical protein GW17_00011121 [Ensete ventricosum]RWW78335.1 hypothetical protein BHE74_00013487 [Ensete ventricosum]RZR93341.1 hypothetical protein BHM03_00021816 [Ensete ventricosum]
MAEGELRRTTLLGARWLLLWAAFVSVRPEPQVPCYFIFGDSLVDNGNNNNIASLAVANYPPYGIDFPGGPSGRFTNGLTTVDVIGTVLSASVLSCSSNAATVSAIMTATATALHREDLVPYGGSLVLRATSFMLQTINSFVCDKFHVLVLYHFKQASKRGCGTFCVWWQDAVTYLNRAWRRIEFDCKAEDSKCRIGAYPVIGSAQLLGFDDLIPPYASTRGQALLAGVNFASAAAGIREETGRQLVGLLRKGGRIPFGGQLQNYQSAVQEMVSILGDEDSAADYLSKCIFSVGLGSNDYLNNYFMPAFYSTGQQYTPEQYADELIQQYSQQLRTLYKYGARKVVLIGVGQVGCSPNELAQRSPDGVACVEEINSAIRIFNAKLIEVVDEFNAALDGAHFIYIDGYGIFEDILRNPAENGEEPALSVISSNTYLTLCVVSGLSVTNRGCCGVGRNNGQITCLPYQAPCTNRDAYLFFDAFHPTEAANIIIGKRSYSARSPGDAYPMDIRRLARL